MSEKQILVLTKVYGKTEAEVKEKLFTEKDGVLIPNDDFDSIVLSWDEARVAAWKKKETTANDNGYKRAQKEILTGVEKMYRDAGIIADGETTEAVIEKFEQLKLNSKTTLTDDDIKKTKLYLDFEAKVKKEYLPKSDHEAKLAEFSQKIKDIELKEMSISVNDEAAKSFNPNDFMLSEDPTRRQNQVNEVYEKLNKMYDSIEKSEDGIVLIKNGKRLEDTHGNPKKISDLIEGITLSLYDKKAQGAAGSAGNENKDPKKQTGKIVFTATTRKELAAERNKKQSEAKTPEERMLISQTALAYEKTLKS
jgi:hypothetical protein